MEERRGRGLHLNFDFYNVISKHIVWVLDIRRCSKILIVRVEGFKKLRSLVLFAGANFISANHRNLLMKVQFWL